PAIVLVLAGCLTKSANVPFHFWLPNAMSAPSPVSALLHSSTMVKAGVYLAARLNPALADEAIWSNSLIVFGGVTMVYGAFFATRRDEFKKILAYSTVSSLGILMMLIGLGATKAAAAYLLAHAMFKGALFLIAGSVIKKSGTKKPESLGGLFATMPVTAVASIVAALSMGGMIPVVAGFAGKELMLKEALHAGAWSVPVTLSVMVTAVFTIMAALVVGLRPYVGSRPAGLAGAVEPPLAQLVGPVILGILTIGTGTLSFLGFDQLVTGIVGSIDGHAHEPVSAGALGMFLKGLLTLPLLLSVVAVVLGLLLYRYRWHYQRAVDAVPVRIGLTFDRVYDAGIDALNAVAKGQTRALQNGSLRWYARMTFMGSMTLIGLALLRPALPPLPEQFIGTSSIIDWILALIIAVAAIAAVMQRKALASIAVLGTVGFVGALIFLLYGAVDVAMTQIATETLIVIIFVLVIYHLPRFSRLTSMRGRLFDAALAAVVGLVMGTLTLLAVAIEPAGPRISAYHAQNSYTEAYGRNIVNVILVDFRGFDTLGELFVLGAAAVGLYTMLRPSRGKAAVTTDATGSVSGEGAPTSAFASAGGEGGER
ncbi:MAG: hydrogen gas-evolving membrane-bound hydrogenase subunit E, partial [Planctomycetota bacterium]